MAELAKSLEHARDGAQGGMQEAEKEGRSRLADASADHRRRLAQVEHGAYGNNARCWPWLPDKSQMRALASRPKSHKTGFGFQIKVLKTYVVFLLRTLLPTTAAA